MLQPRRHRLWLLVSVTTFAISVPTNSISTTGGSGPNWSRSVQCSSWSSRYLYFLSITVGVRSAGSGGRSRVRRMQPTTGAHPRAGGPGHTAALSHPTPITSNITSIRSCTTTATTPHTTATPAYGSPLRSRALGGHRGLELLVSGQALTAGARCPCCTASTYTGHHTAPSPSPSTLDCGAAHSTHTITAITHITCSPALTSTTTTIPRAAFIRILAYQLCNRAIFASSVSQASLSAAISSSRCATVLFTSLSSALKAAAWSFSSAANCARARSAASLSSVAV